MIKALSRLQSLAISDDAKLEKAGKENVKRFFDALKATGLKRSQPEDDNYELRNANDIVADGKEKVFVKELIKISKWVAQKGIAFPDKDGNFYLEAPTGFKELDSQAVINFKEQNLFILAVGNW